MSLMSYRLQIAVDLRTVSLVSIQLYFLIRGQYLPYDFHGDTQVLHKLEYSD